MQEIHMPQWTWYARHEFLRGKEEEDHTSNRDGMRKLAGHLFEPQMGQRCNLIGSGSGQQWSAARSPLWTYLIMYIINGPYHNCVWAQSVSLCWVGICPKIPLYPNVPICPVQYQGTPYSNVQNSQFGIRDAIPKSTNTQFDTTHHWQRRYFCRSFTYAAVDVMRSQADARLTLFSRTTIVLACTIRIKSIGAQWIDSHFVCVPFGEVYKHCMQRNGDNENALTTIPLPHLLLGAQLPELNAVTSRTRQYKQRARCILNLAR